MSFWCLQFFQKTNGNNSTWGTIVFSNVEFFLFVFWENWRYQKVIFESNWPLSTTVGVCTAFKLISLRRQIVTIRSQMINCLDKALIWMGSQFLLLIFWMSTKNHVKRIVKMTWFHILKNIDDNLEVYPHLNRSFWH